MLAFTCELAGT